MKAVFASDIVIEVCMAGILFLGLGCLRIMPLQSHVGFVLAIVMLSIWHLVRRGREAAQYVGRYAFPVLLTYLFFCSKSAEIAFTSFRSAEVTIPYAIIAWALIVGAWVVKECLTGFRVSIGHEVYAAALLTVCITGVAALVLGRSVDAYYGSDFGRILLLLSSLIQFLAVWGIASDHVAQRGAATRAWIYLLAVTAASVAARIFV